MSALPVPGNPGTPASVTGRNGPVTGAHDTGAGAEGRGEVMAVTASHTAITRAPRGIWSPAFPSGFPLPSRRSWVTIVGMGVLYLLMPLGMFFNRSLRQMDTRRRDAPGPAPAVE